MERIFNENFNKQTIKTTIIATTIKTKQTFSNYAHNMCLILYIYIYK